MRIYGGVVRLSLLHALQSNTQSIVVTYTNSSVLKIPIIAATPQPSTIGVTHQISNTHVLSLPSNVSTLSQPLTVGKSKAPQPKNHTIYCLINSKLRHVLNLDSKPMVVGDMF